MTVKRGGEKLKLHDLTLQTYTTKTARRCAATASPMEASWKRRRLFGC